MTNVITKTADWFRSQHARDVAAMKRVGSAIDKGVKVGIADLPVLVKVIQQLEQTLPAFVKEVQAIEPLLAQLKIALPAWFIPALLDIMPVLGAVGGAATTMVGATAAPNPATATAAIAALINAGNTVSVLTQQISDLVKAAKAAQPAPVVGVASLFELPELPDLLPLTGLLAAVAVTPVEPVK